MTASAIVLSCDGACRGNPGPASYGWVLQDGAGDELALGAEPIGRATNNQAEYAGLIAGLEAALARGDGVERDLLVRMDSQLVVRQLSGSYKVKAARLREPHRRARALLAQLPLARLEHVPRELNRRADQLANGALGS